MVRKCEDLESHEILKLLKIVLTAILALVMLILSIYTFYKFRNLKIQYNQILHNWDQGLVMDINYEDGTGCEGPNLMTWNYTWPGSIRACDCRGGRYSCLDRNNISRVIFRNEYCNYTQLICGCDKINPVPPKEVSYWKSRTRVCLQREPTLTFHSLLKYRNNNGTCKENTIACGDLNNPYKKICVPKDLGRCPISSIITDEMKTPEPEYYKENLEFFPGTKLYWSRNHPSAPLAEIRMTEDWVCLNNNQTNISPGRKDNVFMKERRSRCSEENQDPRFQLLDKWGETDLFTFNSVPFSKVKNYRTSNSYKWNLFYRRFLSWHPRCDIHARGLYHQQDQMNTLEFHEITLLVLTIISFIFLLIISCVESNTIFNQSFDESDKFILKYSPIFNSIFKAVTLPSLFINYKLSEKMYEFSYLLFEFKCSDERNNELFRKIGVMIEFDIYKSHFYGIITVVGLLLTELISCISKIYNDDQSSSSSSYFNGHNTIEPLEIENEEEDEESKKKRGEMEVKEDYTFPRTLSFEKNENKNLIEDYKEEFYGEYDLVEQESSDKNNQQSPTKDMGVEYPKKQLDEIKDMKMNYPSYQSGKELDEVKYRGKRGL